MSEDKPNCPECEDNSGVYPNANGSWHCGDCNYDFEDEEDEDNEAWFCPRCGCEMEPFVSESGDEYYQCHCGYTEEF